MATTTKKPKTTLIPIADIRLEVDNHRRRMDPDKLEELKASMMEVGLLNAIGAAASLPGTGYILIWGHRRLKAARDLGWPTIKAEVYPNLAPIQIAQMQAIENLQREDLGPVEEAHAVSAMTQAGMPVDEVAAKLDRSVDWCDRRLDLLRLDDLVADLVDTGRIPVKHGILLARIGDKTRQRRAAQGVVGGAWKQGLDKAAAASDFVLPLKDLRSRLSYLLQKLGACGWPMGEKFAGQRPCEGCPDNTVTEPSLFDGVEIEGKSPKGNCTNESCWKKKSGVWGKEVKKRRDAKAKAEKAAEAERARRKKAKAEGVCWHCGKVNNHKGGEWPADNLCPRCDVKIKKDAEKEKTKKKKEAERAEQYGPRPTKSNPWPKTAEEHWHKALREWDEKAVEKIVEHTIGTAVGDREVLDVAVRVMLCYTWPEIRTTVKSCSHEVKALGQLGEELRGGGGVAVSRTDSSWLLKEMIEVPGEMGGYRRSLDESEVAGIKCVEAIAQRWGLLESLGPMPTLAEFQNEEKAESKELVEATAPKKAKKAKAAKTAKKAPVAKKAPEAKKGAEET